MTALKPTEARLRAMREAVSERGWMPATMGQWFDANDLRDEGMVKGFRTLFATDAGRAWLAENDKSKESA